jgi:hypothetical protein
VIIRRSPCYSSFTFRSAFPGRDEFLQRAAGVVVVSGEEHFALSSFRGDAKRRTRNLIFIISGFPDVQLHI